MGLLAKFKQYQAGRLEKKIAKATKQIKNPKAIKEERALALEFLADLDKPATAIPALLQRFEYSLEHGINDTREKETAMKGILRHEDQALQYVREHLKKTNRIAWPIKILQKLGDESEVVDALIGALDFGDVSFDQAIVDKNYDILCYLAEYKVSGLYKKLAHFLNDPDERVRFATVECLLAQDEHEQIKPMLEPFLTDETSENRRIRMAVINAFADRGWRIEKLQDIEPGLLVEGVFVTKKGKLERRT